METRQLSFEGDAGWTEAGASAPTLAGSQLVLVFGDRDRLESARVLAPLRKLFPDARIVSCSTGGEIFGDRVLEASVTATALYFEDSHIVAVERELRKGDESACVGEALARSLPAPGLRHVLVFSEGLHVNGTALAAGLARVLPAGVSVTGGLAGDGEGFQRTVVGLDGGPAQGKVVAVGLYGDRLVIGMGSLGGWEEFGAELLITRSEGNILYELDGKPALDVYKRLIGAHAYGLPATGLLYPLRVRAAAGNGGVVRTLLSVDEATGSLVFAGDLPEGRIVRLMRANLEQLIAAAGAAASRTLHDSGAAKPDFALLVSCIGRKLLLQQRAKEEVMSVRRVLGSKTALAGFYSYGELSPVTAAVKCELHNQTMTITTISEN